MVARLFPAADFAIDVCADEPRSDRRTEQQMIDPQARVTHPGISEVIPESIDALVWMQFPYSVGPAQSDEACEGFPRVSGELCGESLNAKTVWRMTQSDANRYPASTG